MAAKIKHCKNGISITLSSCDNSRLSALLKRVVLHIVKWVVIYCCFCVTSSNCQMEANHFVKRNNCKDLLFNPGLDTGPGFTKILK